MASSLRCEFHPLSSTPQWMTRGLLGFLLGSFFKVASIAFTKGMDQIKAWRAYLPKHRDAYLKPLKRVSWTGILPRHWNSVHPRRRKAFIN